MKGVILAAGKGTRMQELSEDKPKVLLKVGGRSPLEHIISGMKKAAIDEIIIVIGYKGEQIRAELGDGSSLGVEIEYLEQSLDKYGTAYALSLAEDLVKDSFMLSFGDIILAEDNYRNLYEKYKFSNYLLSRDQAVETGQLQARTKSQQTDKINEAAEKMQKRHVEAVLSLNWVKDPSSGGAVYLDEQGMVKRIVEKPEAGRSSTHWNSAGIFIFSPLIFKYLKKLSKSERGEYELPGAVNLMIKDGHNVASYKTISYWQDLATPDNYQQINEVLAEE
ncbi:MAG: nucleotidyltransferase family protein [Halanaerobiales bacterium]|nr:nucleotidyltransferase family protein [Halanaerobiales bacterium]